MLVEGHLNVSVVEKTHRVGRGLHLTFTDAFKLWSLWPGFDDPQASLVELEDPLPAGRFGIAAKLGGISRRAQMNNFLIGKGHP